MKVVHKVKPNDTLDSIADLYGVSKEEIMKINELYDNNLKNVTEIVLPNDKTDFVVVKNAEKEILLEINENTLKMYDDIIKNKSVIASTVTSVEDLIGDKIILKDKEIYNINENTIKYHIVKPLETLESIAKKYNVEQEKLILQNNLKTNRLFVGQKINL